MATGNIDLLINTVRLEFPNAQIRVTGRARTVRRQAELMAERIRANHQEFLRTYITNQHINEMFRWYLLNRDGTLEATTVEFERLIHEALARGHLVSNHLSDTARDISWPVGSAAELDAIQARINALGGAVLREPNAAGGRHWHVDWR
jgi:hypothetical protein